MSAEPGSITRHADHFVPIAQITERSRPKRQVVGEIAVRDSEHRHFGYLTRKTWEVNPTGDTNFAGVVQQPERGLAKAETTVRLRSPAPFSGA
jgi:hypothetical protein